MDGRRNNTLWGATYNHYGVLNTGNNHHSYNATNNSAANSSKQLIKVKDNVVEGWLHGYDGHITGFALGTDKKLYTVGYNGHGELGIGNKSTSSSKRLTKVTLNGFGNENVKSVHISFGRAAKTIYIITEKDQLWGWGYNGLGQLGLNNTTNQDVPQI